MATSRAARFFRQLRRAFVVILVLTASATAALWADSYRLRPPPPPIPPEILGDAIGFPASPKEMIESRTGLRWSHDHPYTGSHIGQINFLIRTYDGDLKLRREIGADYRVPDPGTEMTFAGIRYHRWFRLSSEGGGFRIFYEARELTIPIWYIFFALAAYPAFRFGRGLRRWRLMRLAGLSNCCSICRYDLTGNASGICPECGTAIQDRVTPTPSA